LTARIAKVITPVASLQGVTVRLEWPATAETGQLTLTAKRVLAPDIGYAVLAGFDQNTPATPGHVYRVDCGTDCTSFRWSNRSGNLPNIPVNAILLNPNVPGQAFAGTDWGLYYTDHIDSLAPIWSRFAADLPSAMVWDLVIDRGATTLAIFTRSRGAYVWPLPQAPVVESGQGHSQHARPPISPSPPDDGRRHRR
jgi:hypothetical protein